MPHPESQIEQFNALLKRSDFFADCMNTHRQASADLMGGLIRSLIDSGATTKDAVSEALKTLENSPERPSLASSRRDLIGRVRDVLSKSR